MKDIAVYVVSACVLCMAMYKVHERASLWLSLTVNTLLVGLFIAYIIKRDFPLGKLPVIGKYFRK